jgi:hypothetical protein
MGKKCGASVLCRQALHSVWKDRGDKMDIRLPKDIPWPEMEEYLDSAHAFIMAWELEEQDNIEQMMDGFIQKYLDEGKGRIFIYMLAYITASTIHTVCEAYEVDPIEVLVLTNKARMNTFPGQEQ